MKILILGKFGMLGSALVEEFGRDCNVLALGHKEIDIASLDACRETVGRFRPDVIINAAGLAQVDYCETHEEEAFRVNGTGPENLARAAEASRALLVHYSTDYIFDGNKTGSYVEEDAPNPLNVYGRSKLAGEERVQRYCTNHLIIRISWLFGPGGDNFLRKIVSASKQGKKLRVVDDQKGSPTYTIDVAAYTRKMMQAQCRSTYHLTNQGACTWYELAVEVLKLVGPNSVPVEPVPSEEFRLPAQRPLNSLLANDRLRKTGLGAMRHWREAVADYVHRFLED